MLHIESEYTSAFLVQTLAPSLAPKGFWGLVKTIKYSMFAPGDSGSSSPRDVLYDIKPSMRALRSHSAVCPWALYSTQDFMVPTDIS